jgi:lipopolysaccharide/colanic/teichoic acid biosynthesis glycosyltransferase
MLRRLHIRNLPQLWNVWRGEMSLVGPRPDRPEFAQALAAEIPYYRQRLSVRPGIVGWAQINTAESPIDDATRKLEYDLYYVKNRSWSLDAYIVLHTLRTALMGRLAE